MNNKATAFGFRHSHSVSLMSQKALITHSPGFMLSERGTRSAQGAPPFATHLIRCSSLQVHNSLTKSARALELSLLPKLHNLPRSQVRGTSGAIIGRFFRNFSVSVGVYETSADTLDFLDLQGSAAGGLVLIQGSAGGCRFVFFVFLSINFFHCFKLFVRNATDTQCTVLLPQCCRVLHLIHVQTCEAV